MIEFKFASIANRQVSVYRLALLTGETSNDNDENNDDNGYNNNDYKKKKQCE